MSQMLDENFDYFYNHKGFGPQIDSTPVPESIVEAYRGKLPDALLTYWKAMGWAGFGNGLLWLVDPREYADVLNAWIHATDFYSKDRYHVFARGALGELHVWGERTGPSLHINAPYSMIFPSDDSADMALGKADLLLQTWLIVCEKDAFDMEDDSDKPLFERAVKLLGRPGPDEMFRICTCAGPRWPVPLGPPAKGQSSRTPDVPGAGPPASSDAGHRERGKDSRTYVEACRCTRGRRRCKALRPN